MEEHASAVELEVRESMTARAEKGYILPGQMDILFGMREMFARLERERLLALSTMEYKGFPIKFTERHTVNARSVASYNNSFPELVKDLKSFQLLISFQVSGLIFMLRFILRIMSMNLIFMKNLFLNGEANWLLMKTIRL